MLACCSKTRLNLPNSQPSQATPTPKRQCYELYVLCYTARVPPSARKSQAGGDGRVASLVALPT